ncbi:GTP-binding protein [Sphingobium sp. CR2-8]|uniref:GTP-binding protein n=1 Tax=Sphingobium sp. CR2-8 TaxID=1306534 RepID=UPI002DB9F653|nr:GTP-binding protein [Sphingobium sp. CR2-8]MEC3909448.1 GTP-binding protein [Sphingobium sp. CR2-8]
MAPIDVHLVTGFLGTGKTRLMAALRALDGDAARHFLVSDFATSAFDRDVLGLASSGASPNGCICCRGYDRALEELAYIGAQARDGAHVQEVFVETSGLSDLVTLIDRLTEDPRFTAGFQLRSVVSLIDGAADPQAHAGTLEWRHQVGVADLCLITHLDTLPPEQALENAASVKEMLRDYIAPGVPVMPTPTMEVLLAIMGGLPVADGRFSQRLAVRAGSEGRNGHTGLQVVDIPLRDPQNIEAVMAFARGLLCLYPRLMRLKMRVRLQHEPEGWLLLHIVNGRLQPLEWLARSGTELVDGVLQLIDAEAGPQELTSAVGLYLSANAADGSASSSNRMQA